MAELQSIDWKLVLCGINHKTSSLEQREPLQLGHEDMAQAHALMGSLPGVLEATIISTCNRVEFYFVCEVKYSPFQVAQTFYRKLRDIDIAPLRGCFYISSGAEAAAHLFRVAAGIDSMVLGENQIVGQLRDAYSSACAVKTAGKMIHRLFHQAFRAGKQVRSDTEMGKGACSVSSAAVGLLREKIDAMHQPSVLFVGINQMISLAAKNIRQLEVGQFLFANRTVARAEEFAGKYQGKGYPLTELEALLGRADVVISCTGSTEPVITAEMIDNYLASHPDRRLLIMDMAIPRDVAINDDYHDLLEVHDLESIQRFVKDQQKRREQAIPQAEMIIQRKLDEFTYWYDHVIHEPVYNGLKDSFEAVRRQEIAELLKKLPPELRPELEDRTRQLVNRLLKLKIRQTSDPEG